MEERPKYSFVGLLVIVGLFIQGFSWLMYASEEDKANHNWRYVVLSITFSVCLLILWHRGEKASARQARQTVLIVAGFLLLALLVLHIMLTVCS